MEAHHPFTYFAPFISDPDTQKFITAIIVAFGLVLIGRAAALGISSAQDCARAIIPPRRVSFLGLLDFFIEAFVRFQDSILGKENRKFLPFTGTIFFFILISNLIGLIPGVPALTTTVWVNVGMAVLVFIYFNYLGIRYNGLRGYLVHFFGTLTRGPLVVVGLFLFLLEVLFTLPLRILTLNLRLYWNITADHTVLEVFTGMVPYGLPVVFYFLALLVCFMQAFIFTTLTMVYILLAIQHSDHDEEEGKAAH
jgi:F-type H+-transporting ATPase subunit a